MIQTPIKLVILTGASASGKTTISKNIAAKAAPIINCKGCEEQGVQCAPLPARIIDKGLASDRVVIDTAVSKYADHLLSTDKAQSWHGRPGSICPRRPWMVG
jgi:adenylate kinase family enzyme